MIINFNTKTNKLKKGIKTRALALVARKRSFEEFSETETREKMAKTKKKLQTIAKKTVAKGFYKKKTIAQAHQNNLIQAALTGINK